MSRCRWRFDNLNCGYLKCFGRAPPCARHMACLYGVNWLHLGQRTGETTTAILWQKACMPTCLKDSYFKLCESIYQTLQFHVFSCVRWKWTMYGHCFQSIRIVKLLNERSIFQWMQHCAHLLCSKLMIQLVVRTKAMEVMVSILDSSIPYSPSFFCHKYTPKPLETFKKYD